MKKETQNDKITRKDAIKKMGKYAALTALGTFVILNPLKAQQSSQDLLDCTSNDPTNPC